VSHEKVKHDLDIVSGKEAQTTT